MFIAQYQRRQTVEVKIGDTPLGSMHPIRVQSMTTTDTLDTEATVLQSIRMIEAGCEYVRITAPSVKEAENLANIRAELAKRGYFTPIVADIHFTPNAAEIAGRLVQKVRINPGNYADKKRFEVIDYTESAYQMELDKIREKFTPLVKICKEYGTAMRIGTNHGSLSDRIMSRYGDTPLGMVESALEFLRICEDLNYYNLVLSMKSSNPQVMVQAYRLLVQKLAEENLKPYPLHLGVTEAGDGEDGRVKSAIGIGTLLEEGLGDTVRVSLTEEPEAEMPVGRKLVQKYETPIIKNKTTIIVPNININNTENTLYNPFAYTKRTTHEVENFGKDNVPRVLVDMSEIKNIEMADFKAFGYTYLPLTDKWGSSDLGADYVYLGEQNVPFMMPNGLKAIQNHKTWLQNPEKERAFPLLNITEFLDIVNKNSEFNHEFPQNAILHQTLNFLAIDAQKIKPENMHCFNATHFNIICDYLKENKNVVLVLSSINLFNLAEMRIFFLGLKNKNITNPIIVQRDFESEMDFETLQLNASVDVGGLLIDGFGEGIFLKNVFGGNKTQSKTNKLHNIKALNHLSFNILQASRTRITKAEYISCPSCGRTLFDLQETTAMIRQQTDHLKGIKIGIMGCIVNGPGEMADADYGYVGSGKGKITLYRGQEVVKRSVPSANAVQELINLIKEDGKWTEVKAV